MKKIRRPHGLLRVKKHLNKKDLNNRTAPEGEFRIIAVHQLSKQVWIEDTVSTFAQAKHVVDTFREKDDVIYYVHNDSNRIIYDSKKE
jgi:hypothetical protein